MKSDKPKLFSLAGCTIFFGVPLSGFGDGSAMEAEAAKPAAESTVGADGSVAWAQTDDGGDYLIKIKIRLLQTAGANADLTTILEAQRQPGGPFFPFLFKDQNGLDAIKCTSARIMGPPKMARGAKIETQEWTLEGVGRIFAGGN